MKETLICRLCLEPIYNYICIDCFLQSVKQWLLSKHANELIPAILQKHEEMKRLLTTDENIGTCTKCKEEVSGWACPCCYLYEMYILIKNRKPEMAKEFERLFNLDFNFHHGFSQLTFWQSLHRQILSTRNFQPAVIVDGQNKPDMNICENCGQASDNLKNENGSWLCESCNDG